jgi:phenylacetate-coenzyme A ligase PaaK-like adenylate-forming protein
MAAMIAHLRSNIPYYRNFSGLFSDLPIIDKNEISSNYKDFLSIQTSHDTNAIVSALSRFAPIRGGEAAVTKGVVLEQTSGSSGVPFQFVKTIRERNLLASAMWGRRRAIDPSVSVRTFLPLVNMPTSPVTFRVTKPESVYSAWRKINDIGIRWVHLTPYLLQQFTTAVQEFGRISNQTVAFAECTGQTLASEVRETAAKVLAINCVDQFACREVWVIGSGATHAGRFDWLNPDVHLEILSEAGPAKELEYGRIIITSWRLNLMPFVRYDTGDYGRFVRSPEGNLALELISGRPHDRLVGGRGAALGNDIFKAILKQAYAKGCSPPQYIKFIQHSATDFEISHFGCVNIRQLLAEVEYLFNTSGHMQHHATFREIEVRDAEVSLLQQRHKGTLFSSEPCAQANGNR